MYDLHLSAEQIEFRDTVRRFVDDVVKSVSLNASRLDAGDRRLPTDLLDQASRMGLRTMALPEELGGAGADGLTSCIVTEELSAGDSDIAAVLAETSSLGRILFSTMSAAQRDRFLPHFLNDDRHHLACADHEPGEDGTLGVHYHRPTAVARRIATTARRSGSEWVIDGAKDRIANAPIASLFAVEVATDQGADQGVQVLLVARDSPGLTVTEDGEPRWHHGTRGAIRLDDCRVPADNALGSEAQTLLADRRSGRGNPLGQALGLGIARAAYEAAREYAQLRVQGGRRLIEHQAIGSKLAGMAIRLEVARHTIWQAAWACDHADAYADRSLSDLPLAAVAQVFASEAVYQVAKDAAECFGAMGVMRDMPLQKYVHDARICLYSGNGNADAKLRIAESLAGYRREPSSRAAE